MDDRAKVNTEQQVSQFSIEIGNQTHMLSVYHSVLWFILRVARGNKNTQPLL